MLALSVAFLMNQAGLVALGAASVYGGAGYLFAIAISEWDMTAIEALLISFVIIIDLRGDPRRADRSHQSARLHDADARCWRDDQSRRHAGRPARLHRRRRRTCRQFQRLDSAACKPPISPTPARFWPVAWTAAWIAGLIVWAVRRSRLGAILRAVRENEERMRFAGFDTYAPRLIAFVLINGIAAICGLLHVLNAGFVSPGQPGLSVSTNALVAALIGGVGEFDGANRRRTDFRLCARPIRCSRRHAALHRHRGRRVHRALSERRRRRDFGRGAM